MDYIMYIHFQTSHIYTRSYNIVILEKHIIHYIFIIYILKLNIIAANIIISLRLVR